MIQIVYFWPDAEIKEPQVSSIYLSSFEVSMVPWFL